jgi:hypothetical protein
MAPANYILRSSQNLTNRFSRKVHKEKCTQRALRYCFDALQLPFVSSARKSSWGFPQRTLKTNSLDPMHHIIAQTELPLFGCALFAPAFFLGG